MRKLAIGPALLGTLLVAGAANAQDQQHPWVPSSLNSAAGGLANVGAPAVAEQHPWVPSSVYAGNQPNPEAPAYAAGRNDAAPAAAHKRHAAETR